MPKAEPKKGMAVTWVDPEGHIHEGFVRALIRMYSAGRLFVLVSRLSPTCEVEVSVSRERGGEPLGDEHGKVIFFGWRWLRPMRMHD